MPGHELPITHRTASPDEAIALGSKDVHVRRLLVEAVHRKIGAVFEEIDRSSIATELVGVLVQIPRSSQTPHEPKKRSR